ncbi:serine/threonine-protein kinase ATM-like [Primulina tabacum]|uniref:serine/threonine-protein kinase ATM-like n=1 Tax=Primulina tabacum TaxID=48773 RepID=UPI003F5A51BC
MGLLISCDLAMVGVNFLNSYLLNLIGQFIGCDCLLDQCCCIISTLLNISRDYPSGETIRVLGEQLQFLVSESVACYIPCGSNKKLSVTTSSRAVLLLQQLTIGADSSMVEYIKFVKRPHYVPPRLLLCRCRKIYLSSPMPRSNQLRYS